MPGFWQHSSVTLSWKLKAFNAIIVPQVLYGLSGALPRCHVKTGRQRVGCDGRVSATLQQHGSPVMLIVLNRHMQGCEGQFVRSVQ